MHTLIALLLAAAAACALPRPPGPSAASAPPQGQKAGVLTRALPPPLTHDMLAEYFLPRLLLPPGYDDSPISSPVLTTNDLLNKEIDRINQMEMEELMNSYDSDLELIRLYSEYVQAASSAAGEKPRPRYLKLFPDAMPQEAESAPEMKRESSKPEQSDKHNDSTDGRKQFALTPLDKEYFQPASSDAPQIKQPNGEVIPAESGEPLAAMLMEPPRQTRQNPINLGKQKHLLEPDLEKLKAGLANKNYRLPVSLLPSNLRWLKIDPADMVELDHETEERSHEDGDMLKQHQIHVLETAADPADSIYSVALIAAVGAALAMALIGFAFGWYTLSKKAKAAADVDYPAYGVTGPSLDTSGDRKLAHSAHMYHYQHQKQQIIAMERNGMEQRTGSVSDPESEEENEEGDYTVYECPGFATTGDMEVKNPLFSEEPTPITPAKCEVVKQQPKD